jgi:hypothetical protein
MRPGQAAAILNAGRTNHIPAWLRVTPIHKKSLDKSLLDFKGTERLRLHVTVQATFRNFGMPGVPSSCRDLSIVLAKSFRAALGIAGGGKPFRCACTADDR